MSRGKWSESSVAEAEIMPKPASATMEPSALETGSVAGSLLTAPRAHLQPGSVNCDCGTLFVCEGPKLLCMNRHCKHYRVPFVIPSIQLERL